MTRSTSLLGFCAVAVVALWLPAHALAQAHPTRVAPTEIRHIQTVTPGSGPPGTVVSLSTLNLPLEARVHVGVGAMQKGFEALVEAEQGEWGEIAVRVTVPSEWTWDQPLVFIAFNAVFAPIGMSDPFHVTDQEGRIRRSGTISEVRDGCLMLEDEYEYTYALTGDAGDLAVGDEVTVSGVYLAQSPCYDGSTIGVAEVRKAS